MTYGDTYRLKVGETYALIGYSRGQEYLRIYKFVKATRKGFNFELPNGKLMSKRHYYDKKWAHKTIPYQQRWFDVELSNWIIKVEKYDPKKHKMAKKIKVTRKSLTNINTYLEENENFETPFAGLEI